MRITAADSSKPRLTNETIDGLFGPNIHKDICSHMRRFFRVTLKEIVNFRPLPYAKYRFLVFPALLAALAACGGGGGSSSSDTGPNPVVQVDSVSLTASGSTSPVPSRTNTELDFVVVNPATTAASNVVLTVTLGSGLSKAGVGCAASGGATCPTDPQTMSVSTLPAGGSLKYTVSAIVQTDATGVIASSGSVTASNDQVTSNNGAQVSITAYSADVRVLGSARASASDLRSGSSVTYSYTVENAGPDAARDLVLTQAASSAQTVTAITCTASNGATCPATTGDEMVVPTLPSAGTLKFTVTTQLMMDAVASVSGRLKATVLGDGSIANNQAAVSAKTRIPVSRDTPSFVELQSDKGDYIGTFARTGANYSYTHQNAVFDMRVSPRMITFDVSGDEDWSGLFVMPAHLQQLQPGEYFKSIDVLQYNDESGGFDFGGQGRGCGQSGWFIIDDVVYADGQLVLLDLRFEQHCNDLEPALRGQIHWVAGDETPPPGPVDPPPPGLWDAPAGATPASGNYVYLESDPGDYVGQGRTELFTQLNSVLGANIDSDLLTISAIGNRSYGARFMPMSPLTRVIPGYYPNAQRWPFGNPAGGRFSVSGSGGCNTLTGWFVIDSISFSGDTLTGVDLRFEQHCEGATPALRGKVHWRSDDPTRPVGPQVPPPAGLWAPPANAVPATGNVVYLESDLDDFIGLGLTKAYTPLNSVIEVGEGGLTSVGNRFQLTVQGDEGWTGYFQAMNSITDLQPGYYGNLYGFPGNPAFGGLEWSGEGRGCNLPTGWFVIDRITYAGSEVDSIEMRFEQHCEGVAAALHGYIRWSAADLRTPPPPQNPPPAGLWAPPPGATPATGNYFYFESDADDFIGRGETHLFTRPDTTFELTTEGSQLTVSLQEAAFWQGYFIPMVPLAQLEVGYYGGLTEKNIAKGLLLWDGDGRGCGIAEAWFVVDNVQYVAGELRAIDLRFEQRCKGFTGALRGKLHWRAE